MGWDSIGLSAKGFGSPLLFMINTANLRHGSWMDAVVYAFLGLALYMPPPAGAKSAQCVVRQNGGVGYSGKCVFSAEANGSFAIQRSDNLTILPGVVVISVAITAPGVAEVRGLTSSGSHSRWGPAVRSKVDPACWKGSDFEICAD